MIMKTNNRHHNDLTHVYILGSLDLMCTLWHCNHWNPKWRNASQLLMMKEEHACMRYTMLFGPENILSFLWSQIVVNLFKSLINIVPQLCLRASKTRLYIIFWGNIVLKYLNLTCFHHRLQSHHHYHHQNHVQENYNVPLIQIVVVVVITY